MTKKQIQQWVENEYVLAEYRGLQGQRATTPSRKFRSCQAEVYQTSDYIVLRSYNTDVAMLIKGTTIGVDFLRYTYGYTATSAQHINKFFNDYGVTSRYTYRMK